MDDDPDITLAFKVGLEDDKSFEVYAYTDPLEALSNFRPHFYDLDCRALQQRIQPKRDIACAATILK